MQISFSCDSCKSPFTVDAQLAGRHGRCNACGHRTLIPSPVATDRADARQKDRRPGGSVAAAGPTFDPQRGRSEARLATGRGPSPAGGRSVGWLITSQLPKRDQLLSAVFPQVFLVVPLDQ